MNDTVNLVIRPNGELIELSAADPWTLLGDGGPAATINLGAGRTVCFRIDPSQPRNAAATVAVNHLGGVVVELAGTVGLVALPIDEAFSTIRAIIEAAIDDAAP